LFNLVNLLTLLIFGHLTVKRIAQRTKQAHGAEVQVLTRKFCSIPTV